MVRTPAGAIIAPKLASLVARRIEADVVDLGRPIGTVLGSEAELLARYRVSRAVLREAVRIVEQTGAAQMRRGPGGGLVITAPDRRSVVAAMGVWFSFTGIPVTEMFEAREPMLIASARLAAERRTPEQVEAIGASIDALASTGAVGPPELALLESEMAAVARNPVLALFIESIADVGNSRLHSGRARLVPAPSPAEVLRHLQGYRHLLDAIADGNAERAADRARALIAAVKPRLRDAQRPARRRRFDGTSGDALATRVARLLLQDIEDVGWPVGAVLGSETALVDRYGVSRAVLREAVRILEHHGAVRTKRGPNGGLIVTAPDGAAVVQSARLVLRDAGSTLMAEARAVLDGVDPSANRVLAVFAEVVGRKSTRRRGRHESEAREAT